MNVKRLRGIRLECLLLICLCAIVCASRMFAALPADSLVINSISAAGTNLEFVASFPPGVAGAVLEMRSTLGDGWQSVASLNVPADGGTIQFTIPLPALQTAFFRLNAALLVVGETQPGAQTNTEVSAELEFVAVPPLGPDSTNTSEAVFHFCGAIDGWNASSSGGKARCGSI